MRAKVGATHHPLPDLMHAFLTAGLTLERFSESGEPTPAVLAIRAAGVVADRRSVHRLGDLPAGAAHLLVASYHPATRYWGPVWTAITALVMITLAAGKGSTGSALDNRVLRSEGRVTLVDGVLAAAVRLGLVLNAGWWADLLAGYVLVFYAGREARQVF